MALMIVFVVQHIHMIGDDGEEDTKMIGVYSNQEKAKEAVKRLQLQPGFRDTPEGFSIDPYTLDEDNWVEGYTSSTSA